MASDALDVAMIIVLELGYLASRSGVAMSPFRCEVDFKLPAHVFRRARLLHLQLRSRRFAPSRRPGSRSPCDPRRRVAGSPWLEMTGASAASEGLERTLAAGERRQGMRNAEEQRL